MTATFHERARACIPLQEVMKPSRYWVGILYHNKNPEDDLEETDFLWIKGNSKITVQTIHTYYTTRRPVDIELKLDDQTQSFDKSLAGINYYNDNVIILQAVEKETRAPVEPGIPLNAFDPHVIYPGAPQNDVDGALPLPILPSTRVPSLEAPPNKPQENFYLQELTKRDSDLSIETLEAALCKGTRLLDELLPPFSNHSSVSPDAGYWKEQISNLKAQAGYAKTVIGVVGDTGAGKSSVINALLDEERLVPTNCMRACTAVVTEISYNENADDSTSYRAEIEFIQQDDWAKELSILFRDLLDQGGNVSRETQQQDSEAGIAYAKIKAVYPHKTKDELATIAVSGWERLLTDPSVQRVLGTTKTIDESECESFYRRLQRYVDSNEKPTKDKSKEERKEKKQMEYWPLIKVVRIFTEAPVLSTGAVIVDLPGVHDSNAARAAVCEGYMKQCNGLWIVAPIIRAVDNKAAKELLGESFKRQLKYDGTYGNITFICSKTDDISTTEAYHAFNLDETVSDSYEAITRLENQIEDAKTEFNELKQTQTCYDDTVEDIDAQIDKWEVRQATLEDGTPVYASSPKDKKRKRSVRSGGRSSGAFKKLKAGQGSDDELSNEESSTGIDDDIPTSGSDHEENLGDPLTDAQIEDKLSELRKMKREARRQRSEADEQVKHAKQKLKKLEEEKRSCDSKVRAECIAERNRRSKEAIQQDFASGVKELDQENAAEEDEANFDPDEDTRDYEEVASSLPVFCISSRAYQKLSGHFRKDPAVTGFTELEQTDVPQLKAHCLKLTEASRADGCRKFLNNLSQLLNSLNLWSSNAGDGIKLTDAERDTESRELERQLHKLLDSLILCGQECIVRTKSLLSDNIFGRFNAAIDAAVRCALPTVKRWGQKPNHDDHKLGGYPWSTYKALCRRHGVFANARGRHDWNDQLTDPMMRTLMSGWEKTFQQRLPHALKEFAGAASSVVSSFHVAVVQRARDTGVGLAAIGTLAQQNRTYEASFNSIADQLAVMISEQQKEANRQFTPVITAALESAYEWCTNESGPGSFARMKDKMQQYADFHKDQIFSDATAVVQRQLDHMCSDADRQLRHGITKIHKRLSRDYAQVIRGSNITLGNAPPSWEVEVKKQICDAVNNSENCWQELLDGRDGASTPADGSNKVNDLKKDMGNNRAAADQLGGGIDWSNDETLVEDDANKHSKLQDIVDGSTKAPAVEANSKVGDVEIVGLANA